MKADNNVDAEDLKVNLLTQEIKFAKMLAGNEFNVAIKEKHIKKLANWLKNRSACSQGMFVSVVVFSAALVASSTRAVAEFWTFQP